MAGMTEGFGIEVTASTGEAVNNLENMQDSLKDTGKAAETLQEGFDELKDAAKKALKEAREEARRFAEEMNRTKFKNNPLEAQVFKDAKGRYASSLDGLHLFDHAAQRDITNEIGPVIGKSLEQLRKEAKESVKAAMRDALSEMPKALDEAGKYVEKGFSKIVKGLTVAASAIGGTIAAVTKSALNVGGGFETQMTRVKIISGATAEDLEALTKKAREMGESLPITAQEAASAMELLAQRGTQAKDILASVADVSALAISQNVGMAEASELLGSTMTNFGIAIEKASQVTDIFNNASNQSALNMSKLSEGLKYVGPAASAAGMKLEEAVAAMEVLANAGLSGEMIGTGLSMTLSKIAASSSILGVKTRELDGTMRPLKDIFVELQARGLTLADASKVFGERAAKAALNLAKYSGSLEENERNLQKWGSTQKAVTEQLGTFENIFKGLQSAVEGVRLEIFDQIKEESKGAVGGVTELTRAFRAWIGETQIASKTLKGFLSGLGVDIPSGDEFKKLLASFDVAEFVKRIKGFGGTLKEIGAGFVSLFNLIKTPLTFILKHIDSFAKASFWGWIIGKGMRISKELLEMGAAFKALGVSISGVSVGALGAIKTALVGLITTPVGLAAGTVVTGVVAAFNWIESLASKKIEESKEKARKAREEFERELAAQKVASSVKNMKTGFEELGEEFETLFQKLDEKQKEKTKLDIGVVEDGFVEEVLKAIEDVNEAQKGIGIHFEATREAIRAVGADLTKALAGDAEALAKFESDKNWSKVVERLKDMRIEATLVEGSYAKASYAQQKLLKGQQELVEASKTDFDRFSEALSNKIGDVFKELPEELKKATEFLRGKNLDLALKVSTKGAKEKLEKFFAEAGEQYGISEDIVKQAAFDQLEKLAQAGNRTAQALADSLGVADKRVDDLISGYRDAVEYLEESPAKFLPALQSMVNGLNKVDPVTGKMSEAFKKAKKALKEFADMTFDKLKSRIQQIKEAVEGGFVDRKVLEAEVNEVFEKTKLKITAELLPKRGEYQDPKVFSGVLLSEIRKEMESIGGKGYGDKYIEELRKLMERYNGDLGRYFEDQKRIAKRREEYGLKPQAQQQARTATEQRPQGQDKTQTLAQSITNGIGPFMSKLESAQSVQASSAQALANAIAPVNAAIQTLVVKLGAVQGAVTANTTALSGVTGAIEKAGGAGGQAQKSAPSIHIEINQNGFIIQKRDDAGLVANLAAGALRTGLGNAM